MNLPSFIYTKIFRIGSNILIGLIVFYLLAIQILNSDFEKNATIFNGQSIQDILLITLMLVIGCIVNISIEAYKWKLAVGKGINVKYKDSFKAILVGITYGIFTPNRVGEILGRVLFVKGLNKSRLTMLTLVCSASMTVAGLIIAYLAIVFYFKDIPFRNLYLVTGSILMLFLNYFYFSVYKIIKKIVRFKWWKKYADFASTLKLLSFYDLTKILSLSILKYLSFTFQYYLLISFFYPETSILAIACGLSLVYFIQSFIPTPVVIELGIRGNLTVLFLSKYVDGNTLLITNVAYFIWLVNMLIPAIIGYVFVITKK